MIIGLHTKNVHVRHVSLNIKNLNKSHVMKHKTLERRTHEQTYYKYETSIQTKYDIEISLTKNAIDVPIFI